jgi:hypothetical protein
LQQSDRAWGKRGPVWFRDRRDEGAVDRGSPQLREVWRGESRDRADESQILRLEFDLHAVTEAAFQGDGQLRKRAYLRRGNILAAVRLLREGRELQWLCAGGRRTDQDGGKE